MLAYHSTMLYQGNGSLLEAHKVDEVLRVLGYCSAILGKSMDHSSRPTIPSDIVSTWMYMHIAEIFNLRASQTSQTS